LKPRITIRTSHFILLSLIAVLLGSIAFSLIHQSGQLISSPKNSRAGFGISSQADPINWSDQLGAGWYLNWGVANQRAHEIPEFWQTIRLKGGQISPSISEISILARKYPGQVWLVGNEPDNIWQDSIPPEMYARLYHLLYYSIKSEDPGAKIAIAGVSQASPLRMQYLDKVILSYQSDFKEKMPVDWWTIHAYVLREERGSWGADIPPGFSTTHGLLIDPADHGNVQKFQEQLISFRRWMKERGYQNKPLAITEFGILLPQRYGYTPDLISRYLLDTCQWIENTEDKLTGYPGDDFRLIQQWNWFSLSDINFPVANLADLESKTLTPIGLAYKQCASSSFSSRD
jgi:hypothetical protein